MGRPRRSEAARHRLIAVGVRRIADSGVHGSGINAILAEANVARGSFYNFFPSKEAYLVAVIQAYVSGLLELYDESFAAGEERSPLDRLAAAHTKFMQLLEIDGFSHGCLLGSVGAEVASTTSAVREALNDGFTRWRAKLESTLAEGQADGSVRRDIDAATLAELFLSIWQGALIQLQVEQSTEPLKRQLDLALHLLRAPSSNSGK